MVLYVWQYINGIYQKTALIDYASSVIWVQRFVDAGEFELYVPASLELLELFTDQTILTRAGDDENAMIFEKMSLTTDDENGDYLTITGRSIDSIIERRIVPKQTSFTGTAENCIRKLLTENIISPSDSNRKIDIFSLGNTNGFSEKIDKQVTGKNLFTTIKEICQANEYGFRCRFVGGRIVFELYKGTNRSTQQTLVPPVIFSPQFENLGKTEYTRDTTSLYNAVYVAGEGEGKDRVIVKQTLVHREGLYLRELWVDARTTSSNAEETLSPADYQILLGMQGAEELESTKETVEFSGEMLDVNQYRYGVDYNLGDKVSVVNEYGIKGTAIVTEITEVEDENGYKIVPTFSEWS